MNPTHLLVLAVIAFVLFGAKRLPEMGRSLGLGMREFKNSVSDLHDDQPRQLDAIREDVTDTIEA